MANDSYDPTQLNGPRGRQQTYWNTEVNAYRRKRYSSFTWPVIIAFILIGVLAAVIVRLHGGIKLFEAEEEAELLIIQPTQDIVKHVPEEPGGEKIAHTDKYIYESIGSAEPYSALGAEYQAEMIRQQPEPPMDVEENLTFAERLKETAADFIEGGEQLMEKGIVLAEEGSDKIAGLTNDALEKVESSGTVEKAGKSVEHFAEDVAEDVEEAFEDVSADVEMPSNGSTGSAGTFYTVQTAAMYTAEAAQKEWVLQQEAVPSLAQTPYTVCPQEVRGYGRLYKLYVGSFQTAKAAQAFCDQLKQKDVDCFVIDKPFNAEACAFEE